MSLFSRANAIALIALTACASAPPPAPRPPPEEEAFVLDGKDPNAVGQSGGKSKKKNGKGSASSSSSATYDVGTSAGSSPDHFGRAKIGASWTSFDGQGLVNSDGGRTFLTASNAVFHGIPLSRLTFQFKEGSLYVVYFGASGMSDCKRLLAALERDYGTHVSADQQYTTDAPIYYWGNVSNGLSYSIQGDSCDGRLGPRG